jgi:hypothetical protein
MIETSSTRGATTAIESLVAFGVDALDLELLLVRLDAARALDRG